MNPLGEIRVAGRMIEVTDSRCVTREFSKNSIRTAAENFTTPIRLLFNSCVVFLDPFSKVFVSIVYLERRGAKKRRDQRNAFDAIGPPTSGQFSTANSCFTITCPESMHLAPSFPQKKIDIHHFNILRESVLVH